MHSFAALFTSLGKQTKQHTYAGEKPFSRAKKLSFHFQVVKRLKTYDKDSLGTTFFFFFFDDQKKGKKKKSSRPYYIYYIKL